METKRRAKIAASTVVLLLLTVGVVSSGVTAQTTASVSVEDVTIQDVGDSGNASILLDAENGMTVADAEVSIDTSVAVIKSTSEGEDVNSDQQNVEFKTEEETEDSVLFEYTNIQPSGSVEGFELAVVEFEATGEGQTDIEVNSPNFIDSDQQDYDVVNENGGQLSVSVTGGDEDDGTDTGGDDTDGQTDDGGSGVETDDMTGTEGNGTDSSRQSQEQGENSSSNTDGDTDGQQDGDGNSDSSQEQEGLPGFTFIATVIAVLTVGYISNRR